MLPGYSKTGQYAHSAHSYRISGVLSCVLILYISVYFPYQLQQSAIGNPVLLSLAWTWRKVRDPPLRTSHVDLAKSGTHRSNQDSLTFSAVGLPI